MPNAQLKQKKQQAAIIYLFILMDISECFSHC